MVNLGEAYRKLIGKTVRATRTDKQMTVRAARADKQKTVRAAQADKQKTNKERIKNEPKPKKKRIINQLHTDIYTYLFRTLARRKECFYFFRTFAPK